MIDNAVPRHSGSFAELLRQHRRSARLTQETLAERAGYSTVYISMLERGKRIPQASTVQLLCDALELSPPHRAALLASVDGPARGYSGLVGRADELSLLERHMRGDGPPVLAFAGEPGIGKSRLLREAVHIGEALDWRVLGAGCQRRGGQDPYSPLLEALQRSMRDRTREELRTWLRGCEWMARLLPELDGDVIEQLPAWSLTPARERRLMIDAVRRYLTTIRGPSGTLLILDDMQWAGSDALDFLVSLIHSESEAPPRLIIAYRDTDVLPTDALSVALGDLAHAGNIRHHSLGPLSASETEELINRSIEHGQAPAGIRDAVLRWSAGVPFFVVSFTQELRLGQLPAPGIPWDLAQAIRQRVALVPQPARDILAAAAVAGRRASRSVLLAAGGDRLQDFAGTLEELCRVKLLSEEGDGEYRFSHDVIREVVEAGLSLARRTALHGQVAEALERSQAGASPEVLAYHYARSDAVDKAIIYLDRAGDSARERHAHATAEGYYRELVDRLEGLERMIEAARAREKLGKVLGTVGRYDEALHVLELAMQAYGAQDDPSGVGTTVVEIGRIHYARGTAEEGIERLLPFQAAPFLQARPRLLAALNVALAPLFLTRSRYREQLQAATLAADLARSVDDNRILVEAEVWRGCALNQLGNRREGRTVQERAIPLAEVLGDLGSLMHALNDVAFAYEQDGQFGRSRIYKERALQLAERTGDPAAVANLAFRCGQNAFLRGDWVAAHAYYERAVGIVRQLGESSISPYPLFGLGLLHLVEGDLDTARAYGEECCDRARGSDLQAERAAQGLLAHCDLRQGQPEAAVARLAPLAGDAEGLGLYAIEGILAEAHWAAGDHLEARRWAQWSVQQAETQENRVALCEALRVLSLVTESRDEACGVAGQVLDLSREMGYVYGQIRALAVMATLLDEQGQAAESARLRVEQEHLSRSLDGDRERVSPIANASLAGSS